MSNMRMRTAVGLGLIAIAIAAQAAVPRGAFIRRPVSGVSDLIAHAKTDPIVMERYSRHFRLTPSQLTSYFATLHVAKLAQDGVYLVFNVHPDNVIRGRYFNLKKGTLVFADSSGRPILKKECGNAMMLRLPPLVAEAPTGPAVGPRQPVLGDVSSQEELAVMQPEITPAPIAPPIAPPIRPQVTGGAIAGGGGAAGFGFLPLLLGLGCSSSFLIKKNDTDTPPVPEPATLIILGSGAVAMAAKRRKR